MQDQATIAPPQKDNNLMQRDEHCSFFCMPLYHDGAATTSEERLDMSENPQLTIIIEESHEPTILAGRKT